MGGDSGTVSSSYAGSVASSRSSASRRPRGAEHGPTEGQGDDWLDKRSSLENGVFGVLFTLSKEENEIRIRNRWVALKIMLDGWQLFSTIISPDKQGWDINPDGLAWTIVGVLNFTWLADLGYTVYLAVLYSMLALLAINVIMCVWVAWCFKEHKFPVVWPIKALRVFSKVFFQAFDVACLNLLQLGLSCRYNGPERPHLHLELFPQYSCGQLPHLAHAIVSAFCLALFVAIALLINMAEVEVNLLSLRPSALGHSGAEVTAFGIKVLITLVQVFLNWNKVAAAVQLPLAMAYTWQYLRWSPHMVAWPNYCKTGVGTALVWVCAALTVLVFQPGVKAGREAWSETMTIVMLTGILPSFILGVLLSWIYIRQMTKKALHALKTAKPHLKLKDICKNLDDPRDVEIVARSCRVWKDEYTLDLEAVNLARQVIQAGVAMFPTSPYMVLLHGNFMITVLGVSQSGGRRIEEARKLNPGLMCRFIMFVRQQEATQQSASNMANGGAAGMDLLAYVDYQRKQRMVIRLHRDALQAMCNFWKALDASRVSFMALSKALGKIEATVSQAQAAYRTVLEQYNNDPKLVRLYGKFLQTIKNDPWRASEYFAEAERLEELKSGNDGGPLLPDGTPLGRMDEIASAVVVISSTGEVQMANKHAYLLFGYKRGMLEMKHVTTLMAPHYSRRINEKLAALADATAPMAARDARDGSCLTDEMVVGMHCERLAFPVKMSVQKASGVGEDSTFIVMLDALLPVPGEATLWVAGNGTVMACDPQFMSLFGWKPSEVNGMAITTLVAAKRFQAVSRRRGSLDGRPLLIADTEAGESGPSVAESPSEMVKRLLATGAAYSVGPDGQSNPGVPCFVTHKYDSEPVQCGISVVDEDLSETPVHELRLTLMSKDPAHLLVVNRKGVVLHCSPELVKVLKDVDRVPRTGAPGGYGGFGVGGGGLGAGGRPGDEPALGEMQLAGDPLNGFVLPDFLPAPWKDMHIKLLKATTTMTPLTRNGWTCRKPSPPGPTLEMRTASGKPLFMRVAVTTTDISGELSHVIRMKRSSADAAIGERRLRLSVNMEGRVVKVSESSPPKMFGLDYETMAGRGLWEFIDWSSHKDSGALPEGGPQMFTSLVKRAVTQPGNSWRISVSPPVAERVSGGVHEIFAAARASLAQKAVLQVLVTLPTDDMANLDSNPDIFVELWPLHSVTGVVELDGSGRIKAVLEERTRPAGLLFGVPSTSLMGSMLSDWVEFPAARTKPSDLLTLNTYKKSSLKTGSQEAGVKVGPVFTLDGCHVDGRSLMVDVQVVGKPGPGQPSHAILRFSATPVVLPISRAPSLALSRAAGALSARHTPATYPATPTAFATPAVTTPTAVLTPTTAAALELLREGSTSFAIRGPQAAAAQAGRLAGIEAAVAAAVLSGDTQPATTTAVETIPSLEPRPGVVIRSSSTGADRPNRFGSDGQRHSDGIAPGEEDAVLTITPSRPSPAAGGPAALLRGPPTPGSGVPVPGVTLGRAGSTAATGRNVLAELVKSVEDTRGSVTRGSTMGSDNLRAGLGPGSPVMQQEPRPVLLSPEARASRMQPTAGITTAAAPGFTADLIAPEFRGATFRLPVEEDADADADAQSAGNSDGTDGGGGGKNPHFAGSERISKWVSTKGAFYQNSTSRYDESPRLSEDDQVPPLPPPPPPISVGTKGESKAIIRAAMRSSDGAPKFGEGSKAGPASAASPLKHKDSCVPPEDDAGSEGGQSAISAQSGSGEAEYKRGKRFKKLMKLMDSSQTQQVQRRFWTHALVTVTILAVIHVVCFIMTVTTIEQQKQTMLQLSRAGQSQRYMHEILTDVRSLDVISRNMTVPRLYTPEQGPFFIQRLAKDAEEVQIRLKEIMDAHHARQSNVLELFKYSTRTVWDGFNPDGSERFTNLTIWDFATRFYVSAKDIEQNGAIWLQTGVAIANTTSGYFLIRSGPDLWRASRQILDALLYEAVDSAHLVDVLQIVFLTVEGVAISCIAALYLAYLLRALAAQRYKLYGTFLVIPVGLTRALASQNTSLMLNDDDDDDDDDDGDEQPASITSHDAEQDDDTGVGNRSLNRSAYKQKRRALTIVEANLSNDGPSPAGAGTGPGGGARGAATAPRPGRPSFQGGGNVSITSFGTTESALPPYGTLDSKRIPSMRQRSISGVDGADSPPSGYWGALKWRLARLGSRRGRGVTPLPRSSKTDTGAHPDNSSKRRLKYDSHETVYVLLPFIAWSVMVIAIYATAVFKIKGVVDVVAVHSVANFMSARTYRAVFFSQELAVVEDPAQLAPRRAVLVNVTKTVRDAWYTLQLGENAYRAAGPSTERFPLVKDGLAYSSAAISRLMYENGHCHRLAEHMPCPDPDFRYYKILMSSLDSLMQVFIYRLTTLTNYNSTVGLTDDNIDFIYNVGGQDLVDGTVQIQLEHYNTIIGIFRGILILHILLFLFFWVIFIAFFLLLLSPLLRKVSRERRRIAELMSQLPLELDVERLVARALGAVNANANPNNASTNGPMSPGGDTSTHGPGHGGRTFSGDVPQQPAKEAVDVSDGAAKWKAIIRMASSQAKVQPEGGGAIRRSSTLL